jgi:hypothetical protein
LIPASADFQGAAVFGPEARDEAFKIVLLRYNATRMELRLFMRSSSCLYYKETGLPLHWRREKEAFGDPDQAVQQVLYAREEKGNCESHLKAKVERWQGWEERP